MQHSSDGSGSCEDLRGHRAYPNCAVQAIPGPKWDSDGETFLDGEYFSELRSKHLPEAP